MSGINSQTITIMVVDLSCCHERVQRLKRLLKSVKGVESISIDVKSGTVIVSGHIDRPHQIVEEIKKKGNAVSFYSCQSDDDNWHQQPISKPDDPHRYESNKDFGESSGSTSQRQSPPIGDDDKKRGFQGSEQSKMQVRQVNEHSNFHDTGARHGGISVEGTKRIHTTKSDEEYCHGSNKYFEESSNSTSQRQACPDDYNNFRHRGGQQSEQVPLVNEYRNFYDMAVRQGGIGVEETDHIHGAPGLESSHFCSVDADHQTSCFYPGEGVDSRGQYGHHNADWGCGERHLYDNPSSDPSWSLSDLHNFHGPQRVHYEAERSFNSQPNFDSLGNNYTRYPEMMSQYHSQIPRQQNVGDPMDFLIQFFRDDNPFGCLIM